MLRNSPVKAIRFAMLAIVAVAVFAGAVSGEPERVYMPSGMGIACRQDTRCEC